MKHTTLISTLLVLTLAVSTLFFAGCSSQVTTKVERTHTVHYIDSGPTLQDGTKIIDLREIQIAIYHDGKAIGDSKKVLNGLIVIPPHRWDEAARNERILAEYIKRHPETIDDFKKIEQEVRK